MLHALRNDLHLLRRRVEALYNTRPDDEHFQDGLNFAVSGLEQAMDALGEVPDVAPHPDDTVNDIENALAELHIRLDTRHEASNDDPVMRARLAMAHHLLAQACTLLADD
jgi:hypothetical protein